MELEELVPVGVFVQNCAEVAGSGVGHMKGSGAVLALLWLCGCPPSHQQQHYHQPPQQHQRPPAEKPSVRRVNAALDVPPAQRIPSDLVLKDGSTLERTYVGGTHHWNDPVVHTWENVLSPEECQQIIDLAKPGLMRANVSDDSRGHTSDSRTNDNSWLSHDRSPLTWALVERIAAIVGVPPTHAESIQVIHYGECPAERPLVSSARFCLFLPTCR